jgi:hypothetical protein
LPYEILESVNNDRCDPEEEDRGHHLLCPCSFVLQQANLSLKHTTRFGGRSCANHAPYVELYIRHIIWRAFLFGEKAEVADLAL